MGIANRIQKRRGGRWEIGNGIWEMGDRDRRWEIGDGRQEKRDRRKMLET